MKIIGTTRYMVFFDRRSFDRLRIKGNNKKGINNRSNNKIEVNDRVKMHADIMRSRSNRNDLLEVNSGTFCLIISKIRTNPEKIIAANDGSPMKPVEERPSEDILERLTNAIELRRWPSGGIKTLST